MHCALLTDGPSDAKKEKQQRFLARGTATALALVRDRVASFQNAGEGSSSAQGRLAIRTVSRPFSPSVFRGTFYSLPEFGFDSQPLGPHSLWLGSGDRGPLPADGEKENFLRPVQSLYPLISSWKQNKTTQTKQNKNSSLPAPPKNPKKPETAFVLCEPSLQGRRLLGGAFMAVRRGPAGALKTMRGPTVNLFFPFPW